MDQNQLQQLQQIIDIFLSRKKLILSCVFISTLAGLVIYLKTPKMYETTSLIMYQRQSINPTETPKHADDLPQTLDMISTLTEQVTSRTNLEELIKQFNLYPEMRAKLPMQDVVDRMRSEYIRIKPEKGDVFKVILIDEDQKKVMQVTNALTAKFIEEDLRFRSIRATETSAYVKDELAMAKETLDKTEATLRDYKLRYYNEMPQQLQVNMTRLNSLQEQYQNKQKNIQEFERMKLMLNEQVSLRQQLIAQTNELEINTPKELSKEPESKGAEEGHKTNPTQTSELDKLKLQLTALRSKYTEKHPEVRRAMKLIEDLEKSEAEETATKAALLKQGTPTDSSKTPVLPVEKNEPEKQARSKKNNLLQLNPQTEKMDLQLKDIDFNIAILKKEGLEIIAQIAQYTRWVENTPIREAEWSALTRDYEELKNHYENLVTKNLQAESTESLERRQKGSQFKVIDPAHFPEKPFKPNFIKIMLSAVFTGIALGGGLAFVLGSLADSFKTLTEVESFLELPVLCAIPVIHSERLIRLTRIKNLLWTLAFALSFACLLGVVIYLWHQGSIIV